MHKKTLSIIGAGKVGQVLGHQFVQHQVFSLLDVCNRSFDSAERAVAMIGAGRAVSVGNDLGNGIANGIAGAQLRIPDVLMLTVPDDQIATTCQALVDAGMIHAASVVFHCSGAKASTELRAAIAAGAKVASVHPVCSFANVAHLVEHFSGTICSLEGDDAALAVLLSAMQSIGARTVGISAGNKLLYHAGSVFASNYLVSLMELALQTYQAAGIPAEMAMAMAQPLAQQSLSNVFQMGPAQALTGPIARGDMATVVKQQLQVAQWNEQAGAVYQAFIAPTVDLAAKKQ
ncbi:Rossmann-like and DUF2520 domain-containing protein [Undibacterium sp. RuTC16W]|uniref:Rossmann-like and DUF2520 domain-containing protein n=1 Tax=Undibacterium sp. RuTC16W TaxID=3413048 RepID=UPI003BF32948